MFQDVVEVFTLYMRFRMNGQKSSFNLASSIMTYCDIMVRKNHDIGPPRFLVEWFIVSCCCQWIILSYY